MGKGPLTFDFKVDKPSAATISLGGASASGASVSIRLDGSEVQRVEFVGGSQARVEKVVPLPPGAHKLELENTGSDWVMLNSVAITNLAPEATATSLAESDWMIARVTAAHDAHLPTDVHLAAVPLADADYDLVTVNLETGTVEKTVHRVRDFRVGLRLTAQDEVLIFKRK
jgi:hypothetical protein